MKQFTFLICCSLLFSCGKKSGKFVESSNSDADTLEMAIRNSRDSSLVQEPGASNKSIKKQWLAVFKACMSNNTFDNPFYLGVVNLSSIGTIYDKKTGNTLRELDKIIPNSELAKLMDNGSEAGNCQMQNDKNLNFSLLLGADLTTQNAQLNAAYSHADTTTIDGGKWTIIKLRQGDLQSYLDTCQIPGIKDYKNSLLEKNARVVLEVVRVSGFKSSLKFSNNINTSLQDSLKSGVIANLANGKGSLRFTLASNKSINVESSNDFIVFGKLWKYE